MTTDLVADKLETLEHRIERLALEQELMLERLDRFDVMTTKLFDLLQEIQIDLKAVRKDITDDE